MLQNLLMVLPFAIGLLPLKLLINTMPHLVDLQCTFLDFLFYNKTPHLYQKYQSSTVSNDIFLVSFQYHIIYMICIYLFSAIKTYIKISIALHIAGRFTTSSNLFLGFKHQLFNIRINRNSLNINLYSAWYIKCVVHLSGLSLIF